MPEPTTSAGFSVAAAGTITAMGISLGLRVDILVAGFFGALVAMAFFNIVPSSGDTVPHLLRTSLRRIVVAFASSLTAGYLTPLVLIMATLPESAVLGGAFGVGAGAQQILLFVTRRLAGGVEAAK